MEAGMIFVLCLGAGFLVVVVYLAVLSRRSQNEGNSPSEPERDKKNSRPGQLK